MRPLAVIFFFAAVAAFAAEKPTGTALINTNDLSGWQAPEGLSQWSATKGVLASDGEKVSWLRTESEYTDFVLRLEYRLASGANSGVSVRCPKSGDPAHDGLEVQLIDDAHALYKNLKPEQYTGAIYMQAAARTRAAKPAGEWNQCEISCRGVELVVRINGIEVNRVNLNSYKKGLDGRTPLSERARSGVIALEARGGHVEFQKLFIERL